MRRQKGFTLVELLVVIAIIAILIAILLPVLQGVRHRFLVLACPIAYVGKDCHVHLTDPQGGRDVVFDKVEAYSVAWSPSGRRIGIVTTGKPGGGCVPGILDPMSGRVSTYTPGNGPASEFALWLDDTRFYEWSDFDTAYLRDADTGAVLSKYSLPRLPSRLMLCNNLSSGPLPPQCAPLTFVAIQGNDIVLLRKDLSVARRIPNPHVPGAVRADPLGEWVAYAERASGSAGPAHIALRRINDLPSIKPVICEGEFASAEVSDWSEDGNLILGKVWDSKSDANLMLWDKNGRLVRKIPTAVPINGAAGASWRKYGHR